MAAAGLWTTAADLGRFVVAVQRCHTAAEDAILPNELVSELLTPQAANVSMGLGLRIDGDGPTRRFGHGGDDQGFVAGIVGYAEYGLGAVVMTNSDFGFWVIQPLLEAVAREYHWPDYPEDDEPERRDPSVAGAAAYVGVYESDNGVRFVVKRGPRGLVLALGDQPPIELLPASATTWHGGPLAIDLTFELVRGRVVRARLHQEAEYVHDLELTRLE